MKAPTLKKLFFATLPLSVGFAAHAAPTTYNVDNGGAITDNNTTTFFFTVNDSIAIGDLDLRLALKHEELSNLTVSLESPSGIRRLVFQDTGGANPGRFQDAIFDDGATLQLSDVPT